MKKLTSKIRKFDSNLWYYHFSIPDEIAKELIIDDNKRVICTVNGEFSWPAAIMKSEHYWFILVNKSTMNKLSLQEGASVEVTLEKDNSTYGFEMPEEFQTLIDQDDEVNQYFHQLTKGKQRSLIYIITKVKSPDSRLRKALAIGYHLKDVQGNLNFKLLNETIKAFNNKAL